MMASRFTDSTKISYRIMELQISTVAIQGLGDPLPAVRIPRRHARLVGIEIGLRLDDLGQRLGQDRAWLEKPLIIVSQEAMRVVTQKALALMRHPFRCELRHPRSRI